MDICNLFSTYPQQITRFADMEKGMAINMENFLTLSTKELEELIKGIDTKELFLLNRYVDKINNIVADKNLIPAYMFKLGLLNHISTN